MCGIIGCVGSPNTLEVVLGGLSTLEYRGYDSAGVALANGSVDVVKKEGKLEELERTIDGTTFNSSGTVGIGHTRWSTHGPPSDENAHPHTSEDGQVAVVHNGIIENYQAVRDELEADGVEFTSETDTEVVPHLIAAYIDAGEDFETAFEYAIDRIEGSYAIAAVMAGDDRIMAARNDSPLVLGIGDGTYYLASDVPAFLEHTQDVVYLEDGDIVDLRPDGWNITDVDGQQVERDIQTVEWTAEQTGKSGYDHFMLKEIHEQPSAIRQGLSGRVDELRSQIRVEELDEVEPPAIIHLIACGTSYHAALYGAELLRNAGIQANAYLANEFATSPAPVDSSTLVIGVSQSGETADTLSALRKAKDRGARTLALTNVVGSTMARESDQVMYIRSGPEIGVAATKTFSSQLMALNLLVEHLTGGTVRGEAKRDLIEELRNLPNNLQQVLDESDAEALTKKYEDKDAFFFIGRGLNFPVALEGALKFKEITYEHAEGFAAGELKHGPLALVTAETPVFAIVTGAGEQARKTIGNVKEVEARDAPVIAVTDGQTEVARYADHVLEIPETHRRMAPMLANEQLQLVAYHMAKRIGRSIDKPRNLAKSVTVE